MTGAEFGGVDIDLLADYIGGALTGTPEESAVAARIATDPAWRAAYTSLHDGMAFVSAELGRFEPEPMPAELAARLDAALTAAPVDLPPAADLPDFLDLVARGEPDLRAGEAGETGGAVADPEPVAPGPGEPPARHLTLVGGDLAGGDGSNPVREEAPEAPRARRLRWAAPIGVAAAFIACAGFGVNYLAGRSTQTSADKSAAAGAGAANENLQPQMSQLELGAGKTLASGTDYTHATLGTTPVEPKAAPLATRGDSSSSREPSPAMAFESSPALRRLTTPATLADCLADIEQANGHGAISVESVDYAHFTGKPALIVRFTAANGHWAWASGADCGTTAAGAATLDKVPVG